MAGISGLMASYAKLLLFIGNSNFFEYICTMKIQDDSQSGQRLTFLESVAAAYASRYDEMSDICFLFPNKRAGTFFLKALAGSLGDRPMLAPEVIDVSEFMVRVSGREVATRIDVIFRLYKVYRGLLGRTDSLRSAEDLLDFDRFAPWAETLAADFSEVEKYDADAQALFRNVRDYREIQSNFLTEEQCDVIERYFGYRPASDSVERFWNSVGPEEERTELKRKFVELWRLLPELYEGLLENLESDGLALSGTTFRLSMRRVGDEGRAVLPWRRVVAVGFNMLSTSEARLFALMRDMKGDDGEAYAEFFWDATGPVLASGDSRAVSPAVAAMRRNMRNFPMPVWAAGYIALSDVDTMPDRVETAASPSNVAQVKIASMRVEEWLEEIGPEKIADARAAVVIPDENLLLPLIHSLPPGLESVNLTMGYSMRYTAVASFVYHLKRLQSRQRRAGGQTGFYHEDFRLFMSHPLTQAVIGSDAANTINSEVSGLHLHVVTPEWIRTRSESVSEMLRPLARDTSVAATVEYITRVLDMVDDALATDSAMIHVVNSRIERMQISLYQQALGRLLASVESHGIEMRFTTVFHLADRLLAGEKVTFEGEPLEGLQVMGLLETRALDFDHLVILSMNDKIMPRRARARTFVPDTLRRGYGMPSGNQSEELYAYYFYRLISRARDVTLVYDARAGEGMRSGGKSRFLMQLSMLHAVGSVREKTYSFRLESTLPEPQAVLKTPSVMARLDEFRRVENGRNLSASALMNYCRCQVMFYYKNVVGIKDDPEASDYIDSITQGNIVHDAMLSLYFPRELQKKYLTERILLDSEALLAILSDHDRIARAVRRAVNKNHYRLGPEELDRPLTGASAMVAERLVLMVANAVRCDLASAPVELIGGEITGLTRWKVGNAPEVNVRYALDRVDVVGGRMRIVDYKTGSAHVEARDMDDVFNGAYEAKYMLQLLLYAHILEQEMPESDRPLGADIGISIFDVNRRPVDVECVPVVARRQITSHSLVSDEFVKGMERIITDIFDESVPFEPTADEKNCAYCRYRYLCGRE